MTTSSSTHRNRFRLPTFLGLVFFMTLLVAACSKKTSLPVSLAFYNVENLFDTVDDPSIRDNSHLPDAKVAWNTERYESKLDNLTRVMSHVDTTAYPTLFGLSEVENLGVIEDLVNHPGIKEANYSIIHKDSPDERGIDVALLYREDIFTPVVVQHLRLKFPVKPDHQTRDILYAKGIVYGQDTLHVFINHWVSRWGGREETEPFRRHTGQFLKMKTDSILNIRPKANIIIAGDLNDNPDDLSISKDLNAKLPEKKITGKDLYNLSWRRFIDGDGTLYYRSWDMFDQIIVSGNLLKGTNGLLVETKDQEIIIYDWMLYKPKDGPARPNRTAGSKAYYGGFSDHLPVYIKMSTK